MKDRLSLLIKYPLVIFFGVTILSFFILFIVLPDKNFSDVENRSLQLRPQITFSSVADGSFMERFETYTKEQLPFREKLVKVKAFIKQITLGNENNGIVKGADGYLFETSYGLTPQYNKNVAAICRFASDTADREIFVAIAPTAPELLKDKIPTGFRTIDQKKTLDELKTKLSTASNVCFVNLYDSIMKGESEGEEMYYKTDHHWTSTAAYYAYLRIAESMGHTNPVKITELNRHEVNDFYGTHYAKFKEYNIRPDILTYYDIPIDSLCMTKGEYDSLYDLDKLKIYDKYAMFMRGNDAIMTVKASNAQNGRRLIIFKDSYANCLIPFMTYQYDEIIVVDLRYYSDSVAELIKDNEEADVLLLYNFDFMNEDNHFYRLTS